MRQGMMWQDICMAKKPCPCWCHKPDSGYPTPGYHTGCANQPPRDLCAWGCTGQVWVLPGLQRKCPGVSFGGDHRESCCGGSGWVRIEFDAIALLTALDRQFMAAWEGHRVTETLVSVSLAEATPAGLEHEATGTGADYRVALIVAAHKALGLEVKAEEN